MHRTSKSIIFVFYIMALSFIKPCFAMETQTSKSLMQEKAMLTKSWQLSENYAQGLTVEADPFKALAWQYVYVMTLPHAYPGIYALLNDYKDKVEKNKIDEAFQFSKWLIRNYQLPKRMDENQLIRVFEAKEDSLSFVKENKNAYSTFDAFISEVRNHNELLAKRYKNQWQTMKEEISSGEQLVFGRLQVNGGVLEQSIARDQFIEIDKSGFFIGKIKTPLVFNAKGYQAYISPSIGETSVQTPQNLGLIVLNKLPEAVLGSIVGSIDPAKNISQTGLALIFKDQFIDKEEPWYTPSIAVTKLDNGQFYIKGLAPGAYELLASYQGQKKKLSITVGNGQVKTIRPLTF